MILLFLAASFLALAAGWLAAWMLGLRERAAARLTLGTLTAVWALLLAARLGAW